jgi:copper chaperone
MNQAEINLRNESATIENAEFSKSIEKSSCGGCCGGDSQTIKIGRNKTMNEKRENNNAVTTVTAPEIVCGGCASSIKKALGNVEGVAAVDVDVATKKVTVNHSENVSRERIVDALDRAGFSVAS